MTWQVEIHKKVKKQIEKLPSNVRNTLIYLIHEIESKGPVRGDWPNYGKLGDKLHHCHLKKGKTTYVAVWKEENNEIKMIEMIYVGTHEKAPY